MNARCWIAVPALVAGGLVAGLSPGFGQSQSLTIPKSFTPSEAASPTSLPEPLQGLGFDQNLGAQVPLDLELIDHRGERVRFGDLVEKRPVIIAPVYFDCPMLCSLVLDGLVRAIRPLEFSPGREFDVLAVSFDPGETFERAAEARQKTLARYQRPDTEEGWRFLVGVDGSEAALMAALGFHYRYDPETDLYAHSGGVVVVTPEGEVSRYFFGVDYAPKDLRLALVEAGDGKVGSLVDQVLLFCFQYDPKLGRYSAATMNLVRAGGVLTVLLLGGFLFLSLRRERRASVVGA